MRVWRPDRLVLAFAALLFVAHTTVGDSTVWGEWLTVWPPVGWLPILTPALLRYRNWLGLALLLVVIAFLSEWPRVDSAAATRGPGLRVVVWNVAGNASFLEPLADLHPDLILTQESAPPDALWEGYTWHAGEDPSVVSRFPIRVLSSTGVGPWAKPACRGLERRGQWILSRVSR